MRRDDRVTERIDRDDAAVGMNVPILTAADYIFGRK